MGQLMVGPFQYTAHLNAVMVSDRNVSFTVCSMSNNMHLLIYLLHPLFSNNIVHYRSFWNRDAGAGEMRGAHKLLWGVWSGKREGGV